ncbi:hypothetical protein AB0F03_35025 [Streptomyces sp. NPDC028722]|uniref:hypothetical protein n=1 Tax=Streptomyces sp. NPDC028722 TaxID=3155016 RepID=UPI0033D2A4FD
MAIDETERSATAEQGVLEDGTRATPPSAQEVTKAEAARKELAAQGYDISVKTFWWGFEVHLNAEAAEAASQIAELIGDIAGEALPSPYGDIIEAYCQLKSLWIKEVGKTYGCKLVSPWIAPGMLIPISLRPTEDTSLWWTVFETGKGWNEDKKFSAHHSGSNPALAEFEGKLFCVHRGYGSGDESLWWTAYDPASGWSEDRKFPAHTSGDGPALAVFGGKLHCVHRGGGSDTKLWHTTYTTSGGWSPDTRLPAHSSSVGPALAVFDNKLHLVHKGATSDSGLWHATYTTSGGWSGDSPLPGHSTASNPALAVFGGNLHMVHRGSANDTGLWHATFDGNRWSADQPLGAHSSLEGPGLAVFDAQLYMVHRGHGSGDQKLWWATYNGSTWSTDQVFPAHSSGAGPAVITYRDRNGDKNQLLVVHRGYGNRAAGTDAAEVEARIAEEERTAAPDTATP